jgi:radical SAM protein with 4Fe4S-binding SPASM domain
MPDLSWIDDFWAHAGPYIFSREDDNILILPPNRVYKLNVTAARVIGFFKRGGKAAELARLLETRRKTGGEGGLGGRSACGRIAEKSVATLPSLPEKLLSIEAFFKTLSGLYTLDPKAESCLSRVPFDFGFTRLPILGEIAVTYRCNNRCLFCYAGCGGEQGIAPRLGKAELSTGAWKKIIRVFKNEAKIPFFSFTGGEPLLRGDLEELVVFAREMGFEVNLVSNGTLASKERAASLYRAGLRTAQISLEAPEADLHDNLTGRAGAFDETLAGIKALRDAGISVQTNTTITGLNREAVLRMPAFLAGLGISRFAMNMYLPAKPVRKDLFISYSEIGGVIDEVRKQAFSAGLTFFWYSPTPFCEYNPIARGLGNKSCAAVDGLLSIAANGDILPCSSWDAPLGNALKMPFRDIWFSERALFFKNKRFAPERCKACASFTACQGACPLYWEAAETDEK